MEEKSSPYETFSKYEIARIIGARALQITMDAPLLLKISDDKLKEMGFDPLKISQAELEEGVLPISIHRPIPRRRKEKLLAVKEDKVSDEELLAKEQEVEKEIVESAEEMGLIEGDEIEDYVDVESSPAKTEEQ